MNTDEKPAMTDLRARAAELEGRATKYLVMGGLFNPELADHDAVSDLIKDMRSGITDLLAALDGAENAALEKKDISTAPKDGSIFWSLDGEKWRKTRFCSIAETMKELGGGPELYSDVWCNPDDTSDNWEPKIWLPLNALLKNPGATP